jgi:hypothetical protein
MFWCFGFFFGSRFELSGRTQDKRRHERRTMLVSTEARLALTAATNDGADVLERQEARAESRERRRERFQRRRCATLLQAYGRGLLTRREAHARRREVVAEAAERAARLQHANTLQALKALNDAMEELRELVAAGKVLEKKSLTQKRFRIDTKNSAVR